MIEGVRTALLADATVAGLVGTRVYPRYLPQGGALPAIALHLISGVPDQASSGPTGPIERRVQVDCWAERYAAAASLAKAVRDRLDGLNGTFSGITFGGRCRCVHEGDLGGDEPPAIDQGPGLPIAGRRLDFMLWHME